MHLNKSSKSILAVIFIISYLYFPVFIAFAPLSNKSIDNNLVPVSSTEKFEDFSQYYSNYLIYINPFIHIDKNWTETASLYAWCSGEGTNSSPFVIDNFPENNFTTSLLIENTNIPFVIKNSNFSTSYGCILNNVSNGAISNNISNNTNNITDSSILCFSCKNITIEANKFLRVSSLSDNLIGIYESSQIFIIQNQFFLQVPDYEILFYKSFECEVNQNSFINCSLQFYYCETSTLSSNNFTSGQIELFDSYYMKISDSTFSRTSKYQDLTFPTISLRNCNHCTIDHNKFFKCPGLLTLDRCSLITFSFNTVDSSQPIITLYKSNWNIAFFNSIKGGYKIFDFDIWAGFPIFNFAFLYLINYIPTLFTGFWWLVFGLIIFIYLRKIKQRKEDVKQSLIDTMKSKNVTEDDKAQ